MPEARPGAAEYGNQSIIRQQKTRPAGRIYSGCGRVFIVEKPPAKPCITGMRARWRKYGPPAAKILLPAARKRAYSSIVRCFPALFSSIRCVMCSTIFTASFPAIFWRSRNVIFAIPARMQERIYILQLNRISRSRRFRTGSSGMACAAICASRLAAIGSGLVAFLPIVYPPLLPSTVPEDCCRN